MATEAKVDTHSLAYTFMKDRYWNLINSLRGGSQGMRDAGTTYLPKEEEESPKNYEARKARSFLYPGYEDGIARLIAKPFIKPVTVSGTLPKKLDPILTNADRQGTDISTFTKNVMTDAVDMGMSHILVDYPVEGIGHNVYEQNKKEISGEIYPYFTHVKALDLIGWRDAKMTSGERYLTQIRIYEERVEPNGRWGEELVSYIRVIDIDGTWELWRKVDDKQDDYVFDQGGTHGFKKIPLVTLYTNKKGFMRSKPLLFTLAECNLEHWQSYSDHRNILRFARLGILLATGVRKKEFETLTLGPNTVVPIENPDADMKYVEHTGQAIGAGERDLQRLEARMMFLSLLPMMEKPGRPTATGEALEASRSNTVMQTVVRDTEHTIDDAFKLAGEMVKTPFPEASATSIFSNFVIGLRSAADVELLFKMVMAEKIPPDIFLQEMVKHGVLPDTLNVEEVAAWVESQGAFNAAETEAEEEEEEEEGEGEGEGEEEIE